MDPSQLNDTELAHLQVHLQALLGRMQHRPNQPQLTASQPTSTDVHQAASTPPPVPIPPPAPPIAPLTTNPVGAIAPYQSIRLPSLLQAPLGGPTQALQPLSQPFLGRDNLSINMSAQVNQQQRVSAAASQPRQPRLPSRGRRRGPAVPPPSLPRNSQPCIDDCVSTAIRDGVEVPTLRIKFKIYPPQETSSDPIVYRFLRDSWNAQLESYHLLYLYELPIDTRITALIQRAVSDMEASPFNYQFKSDTPRLYLSHETLHLQLLELVNRGMVRSNDGQIRLRRAAHRENQTISDLANDRNRFANPAICIEGNRLVVNTIVRLYPVTVTANISHNDANPRTHTCLSRKVYSKFGFDSANGFDDNQETQDSSSDEENVPSSANANRQRPQPLRLGPTTGTNSASNVSQSATGTSAALQRSSSISTITSVPSAIWKERWIPTTGPYLDLGLSSLENISDHVYETAASGRTVEKLEVRALDMAGLVDAFKSILADAAISGDFTQVLSTERGFYLVSPDDNETIRSLGEGIEREVIHTLLEQYRQSSSQWFALREDGHSTLATSYPLAMAQCVPLSRLRNMAILGAAVAMSLVRGVSTIPLDPVLLHFFVHDCDLHSIHPGVLGEWHPNLKQTISDWIALGPDGDADIPTLRNHFITHHDLQVSSLHDRDQRAHDALAANMLYRAVVGAEPSNHPELQAFLKGFRLPCRNGFNLPKFIRSLDGGSEMFFNIVWTSHITSFTNLESHLRIQPAPPTLRNKLQIAIPDGQTTFESLLVLFLKGNGIPCPGLFAEAKIHFNRLVDLSTIEEDGFRPRMFCWAATGSCDREPDASRIMVRFVEDNDPMYGQDAHLRAVMAQQGKICFRTCAQRVIIPASYVIKLASTPYTADGPEPSSFRTALDHWLLCEFLDAIGNHTIT